MRQKELFIISITVFLTILAWLIVDIYKVRSEDVDETTKMSMSAPINFTFNSSILDTLKEKQP